MQQKNRLASCRNQTVRDSLKRLIAQIEAEIASLEKQIQAHINAHSKLKEEWLLLKSIKGIGERSAAILLSAIDDINDFADEAKLSACFRAN